MNKFLVTCLSIFFLLAQSSLAAQDEDKPELLGLDQRIQSLKQEVVDLNSDLLLLEQELLFPDSAQLSVFFSLDVGKYLIPDSLQILVNGKVVANHLYTQREIDSLKRGGVQRVYMGNIRRGEHKLVAYIVGRDWRGRDIKLAAKSTFSKTDVAKYIELQVVDIESTRQAEFEAKIWD